jgi:hypothetical protein
MEDPRMRRHAIVLAAIILMAAPLFAQQNLPPLPQPRLQTVFPAGARVGTSVEVTFTGTDIEEPEALFFSHSGLKADPIEPPEPPADPKKPPMPPAKPMGRGQGKRVITKFRVTVAPGTPPGYHDVRLVNKWGVSNPRPFVVGDLPEIEEKEPNNDVPQAQKVELNTVINGVINQPTDVDYFSFAGKKGQRVLLHVAASSLDSKAHPAVEVYDTAGNRLTFNRNYRGHDALADITLPADADYFVRLSEFTHTAGGPDYYYRLTLTTGPWIDAIVPPMIEPGKTAQVTVYGRNLPGGQPDPTSVDDGRVLEKVTVSITAPADPVAQQRLAYSELVTPPQSSLDGFEYRIKGPNGSSNAYLMMFARGPVQVEKEPNDKPETPQVITVPGEVAGRVDKRDDRDWYSFTAKKGDVYSIELYGERLGSPADFYMTIRPENPKAGALAELDDNQDMLHPQQFFSRTSDPQPFRFEAKEDGKYLILVGARDAGTEYGPRHLYRLRVTKEQADFRLIVMPASKERAEAGLLPAGGEMAYDVFVWRLDGFKEPITLTAEGLPAGVTCPPQRISPTQKQATLVLSAAANAAPAVAALSVKGTATVNGQQIVREARPATITWSVQPGQNLPVISRVDRQLVCAVRDKPPFRLSVKQTELTVKQGDKGTINFNVTRLWPDFKAAVQVNASPGPQQNQPLIQGVQFNGNNQPVTVAADKTDGTATVNIGSNTPPGTYSYVLRGTAQHQFEKTKGMKVNSGISEPAIPITLTIVPSSLATVSATVGNIKVGEKGELTVKVSRKDGYAGEFAVKLVLPKDVKGVSATEAKIPAGKDEVKLTLNVDKDVKPGAVQNIVVQATGQFEKTAVTSEAKFNLNVVK